MKTTINPTAVYTMAAADFIRDFHVENLSMGDFHSDLDIQIKGNDAEIDYVISFNNKGLANKISAWTFFKDEFNGPIEFNGFTSVCEAKKTAIAMINDFIASYKVDSFEDKFDTDSYYDERKEDLFERMANVLEH